MGHLSLYPRHLRVLRLDGCCRVWEPLGASGLNTCCEVEASDKCGKRLAIVVALIASEVETRMILRGAANQDL